MSNQRILNLKSYLYKTTKPKRTNNNNSNKVVNKTMLITLMKKTIYNAKEYKINNKT